MATWKSVSAEQYPRLSKPMLRRLAQYGEEVEVVPHELLFERGERGVDLLVVLRGQVELVEISVNSAGITIAR